MAAALWAWNPPPLMLSASQPTLSLTSIRTRAYTPHMAKATVAHPMGSCLPSWEASLHLHTHQAWTWNWQSCVQRGDSLMEGFGWRGQLSYGWVLAVGMHQRREQCAVAILQGKGSRSRKWWSQGQVRDTSKLLREIPDQVDVGECLGLFVSVGLYVCFHVFLSFLNLTSWSTLNWLALAFWMAVFRMGSPSALGPAVACVLLSIQ